MDNQDDSSILVEDHTVVREGLVALLSTDPILLSSDKADGRTALTEIESQPDIVLCDLALPGLGGLEVIKRTNDLEAPPSSLS